MEKKKYIVEGVGVSGYGARLKVLEGKYKNVELASLNVTPGEFVKKNRIFIDSVKLAHKENEKIVIAIYEDLKRSLG